MGEGKEGERKGRRKEGIKEGKRKSEFEKKMNFLPDAMSLLSGRLQAEVSLLNS